MLDESILSVIAIQLPVLCNIREHCMSVYQLSTSLVQVQYQIQVCQVEVSFTDYNSLFVFVGN